MLERPVCAVCDNRAWVSMTYCCLLLISLPPLFLTSVSLPLFPCRRLASGFSMRSTVTRETTILRVKNGRKRSVPLSCTLRYQASRIHLASEKKSVFFSLIRTHPYLPRTPCFVFYPFHSHTIRMPVHTDQPSVMSFLNEPAAVAVCEPTSAQGSQILRPRVDSLSDSFALSWCDLALQRGQGRRERDRERKRFQVVFDFLWRLDAVIHRVENRRGTSCQNEKLRCRVYLKIMASFTRVFAGDRATVSTCVATPPLHSSLSLGAPTTERRTLAPGCLLQR